MEKPASRNSRRSSRSYKEPTIELADDFTPPLPSAINTKPNSNPIKPGTIANKI